MCYSEFQPTGFDFRGLGLGDRQDWLVAPVLQTRDSGILSVSNFEAALADLGGESAQVEVHRFGHWGPGWFEIILVHPARAAQVEELEAALENYPILNDSDYSQRQYDAILEAWDSLSLAEKIEFATDNDHSPFAARTSNPFDCNNDCGDAVYSLIGEY